MPQIDPTKYQFSFIEILYHHDLVLMKMKNTPFIRKRTQEKQIWHELIKFKTNLKKGHFGSIPKINLEEETYYRT